ncbi:MAG TPA: sulfite exporter TauE/SafE family protein [Chitinophagaceae bacterium]|nr:sulfite exporter TauE/SafE family protein [Chitinophagaceae bacterium]
MEQFAAYFIAVLIGISLGLVGGGGSILTVPVLVYLLGVDPQLATTYSLFIVGFTSLVGGTRAYMHRLVDFRSVSLFGIPSILTVFVARHFLLPAIPDIIFTLGSWQLEKSRFLMILFAVLMLIAALYMMRNHEEDPAVDHTVMSTDDKVLPLLVPGLLTGIITGVLGAGGGFLIIPALVLFVKLPMKTAVGTSLLIIAINACFGFVFSIGHFTFNWRLLLLFTLLAVLGVFAGQKIGAKLNGEALKKWFGWLVLTMSLFILAREVIFR